MTFRVSFRAPKGLERSLVTDLLTDDWELFVAAVSSPELKEKFVSTIAAWLGSTSTDYPFTDLYDATSGE